MPARNRRRRRAQAWRRDPFAQIPERQIQRLARADVMPGVRANERAVVQSIGQRSKTGQSAIRGYTDALVQALKPYSDKIAGYYGDAEASQATLTDELTRALAGGGEQQGADLAAKLAAINAPGAQTADVAGGAEKVGAGAAGASMGMGTSALARLAGERTANAAYAARQPGIAGLAGLQNASQLELALSREQTDAVRDLRSRVPGMIAERVGRYRDTNFDRALAAAAYRGDVVEAQAGAAADTRARRQELADARRERNEELADAARTRKEELEDAARTRREELADASRDRAGERRDYFEGVREDAFARAGKLINPGGNSLHDPISKQQAFARLWAEFGRALVARGVSKKAATRMLRQAVFAAAGR
jgi:hypothetical protein